MAITLFAEYARSLLLPFFRTSTFFSFDHASHICEVRGYIPELVYLLSVTGQAKKALYLIIDSLDDVSQAITFAKECDDKEIWNDLLSYSMDKPPFIRALLEEVGTTESVNAVNLVRMIPDGLVINGLRNGLVHLIRDFECQWSICEGVARVLRSEAATSLDGLSTLRRRGFVFETREQAVFAQNADIKVDVETDTEIPQNKKTTNGRLFDSGRCGICGEVYNDSEDDFLIGFPCGHVFHLACLFDELLNADPASKPDVEKAQQHLIANTAYSTESEQRSSGVANKVSYAQLIQGVLQQKGCFKCDAWS